MKTADPKITSGRAFVRSLNILLKYARLYGYDHSRTIEQLEIAERELRAWFTGRARALGLAVELEFPRLNAAGAHETRGRGGGA